MTDPARRAEIVRLYVEEGLSCGEIGRRFGVTLGSISRQLAAAGIPRRASPPAASLRGACLACGAFFTATRKERRSMDFCGRACADSYVLPVQERFWAKVDKHGPVPAHVPELGPCWLWTGSKQGRYGQLSAGKRGEQPLRSHRYSWELHRGAIPDGLFVLHKCDTPLCVRPDHLFLGSQADNVADMMAKGRRRVNE